MLEIKSQLIHDRQIKRCGKCKKIKWNREFDTHVYDNAKNKKILQMTRNDDLRPICRVCDAEIKMKRANKNNELQTIFKNSENN